MEIAGYLADHGATLDIWTASALAIEVILRSGEKVYANVPIVQGCKILDIGIRTLVELDKSVNEYINGSINSYFNDEFTMAE